MTFLSRLTFGILLAAPVAIGCSGSSLDSSPGTGGSSGTGGSGGGIPFQAVTPCSTETTYTTTGTTIAFGGTGATDPGFNYAPKCLKVSAGATVTWNGDFATHPLAPSALRGTTTGNPIMTTTTGLSAAFTFPTPGFYAYLCNFHGADDGQFMDGVLWVN